MALALVGVPAGAQAGEGACPTLRPNSGFEWQFQQGVDFDLCRARSTSGQPLFFGMYLGFAANFHPQADARREKGVVGGYDVEWYRTGSKDPAFGYGREALFNLPRGSNGPAPEVHVWIYAITAEQLAGVMRILENVRFNGTF
ncbi:MAG TPA: hypothetical protein VMQ73_26740 [Methylomirabilota bacterium]|nr:hypothetical protein [Methylomirabilota bacterium]